jgi:2-polyprenyl-6-methoxyphenol hydroxylase-like FAD-dependent oxidoreductase
MRQTDVAIVGGGLAGSLAAAMLGRAGIRALLIDPHQTYLPDFRCEKLDESQLRLLRQTGLADAVLRGVALDRQIWIARFGRLIEKKPIRQAGLLYDTLVNAIRGEVPSAVEFVVGKAAAIETSVDRQRIALSDGGEISARLVVLASGLGESLRRRLGIVREELSVSHSISIGFDLKPLGRPAFDFPALTYFPERTSDRLAYLTLFPVGSTMRANLFAYRDPRDPWLRELRQAPVAGLLSVMPGLAKVLGSFDVAGQVQIRPVDLYATRGSRQPGVVLVGDAFATSCPAAGTGLNKVLTDVERLCNVHIPRWLASEGMGEDKIATFYDDRVKVACDLDSLGKALHLRSLSTDSGLAWHTRRWGLFIGHLGLGALRQTHERLTMRLGGRERAGGRDLWVQPLDLSQLAVSMDRSGEGRETMQRPAQIGGDSATQP